MIDRASASDAEQPRGRAREQRRLPAPALRRSAASRRSAIEPAANVAEAAARARDRRRSSGSSAREARARLVAEGRRADLLVGNNVLAQVPDLNDFVGGHRDPARAGRRGHDRVPAPAAADRGQPVRHDLPRALLVLLVPHRASVLRGARARASSTSRSSRPTAARCASTPGTRERSATPLEPARRRAGERERRRGFDTLDGYARFAPRVEETKRELLEFLIGAAPGGQAVAGYGAPGKGNTLLNYCGIRTDFLDYTVDRNPYKHGQFLPGHPHPDPSARAVARDPPRLHPDPARGT